jgi:hypothetical protein
VNSGTLSTIVTNLSIVKRADRRGASEKGGSGRKSKELRTYKGPEPKDLYRDRQCDYGFAFAGLLALAVLAAVLAALLALLATAFAALAAALATVFAALAAAFVAVVLAVEFALVTTALVFALFAFAFAALFAGAASPQAIPRALRPRTVESTITFFI